MSVLETLLALLTLRARGGDAFTAQTPAGRGRLFGGLVAAQALVAAQQTLPDAEHSRGARDAADARALHSLHADFLRPGRHAQPLELRALRLRDGRSFTTRQVTALQRGEAILTLSASFARPGEAGIAHQEAAPEAPAPETLPNWDQQRARALGFAPGEHPLAAEQPIEIRSCDPDPLGAEVRPPHKRIWVRPSRAPDAPPLTPRVQEALLVYASDRTLISTAARPHGIPWRERSVASLDHAVWIHRAPVRFDDWLLYTSHSPVAQAARALVLGALWNRAGERVASVAQEGLVRRKRRA